MIASAGESRGLFGWLLPLSVLAHVAIVEVIPAARSLPAKAMPALVVEMTSAPNEPEPAPAAPEPPAPEPPPPTPVVASRAAAPSATSRPVPSSPTAARPHDDAPVDFTSTTFSSEGHGVAIGGSGGATGVAAPSSAPATPSTEAPRLVPVGSLARAPSAPGLDAELERNYPAEARRSGISGLAVLRVRILPDGRVGKIDRVSESFTGFADACARTVRAGKWQAPIDHDGRAVSTEITYTCRFEVRS